MQGLRTREADSMHDDKQNDEVPTAVRVKRQFICYAKKAIKHGIKDFDKVQGKYYLQDVISMESDLGYMIRTVYAEMRGGDDNAKAIVAESIYNRSQLSSGYEKADGTYKGIVEKFYNVTKPNNNAYDYFNNPIEYIYENSAETNAWRSSVSASLKAHFGLSDVGKGVIFYNSSDSTYYDKNPKISKIDTLNVTHKGIKGLWKLK